jgi:hypothetical protein
MNSSLIETAHLLSNRNARVRPSWRFLRILVVLALSVLALAALPAVSGAGVIDNGRSDVAGSGGALNMCTGEWIDFTAGTGHGLVVETGSGETIYLVNFSGVRGVGTSGNEYIVLYANPVILKADGAGGYTAVVSFKLIQVGAGTNYNQQQTGHLTIAPDGRIVVEFYDLREGCVG